jgi:hypothetical protein
MSTLSGRHSKRTRIARALVCRIGFCASQRGADSRSVSAPRNGSPEFNPSLFSPNALGTPGNSSRRFFAGPGIENFDIVVHKVTRISESKSLELRFETFNSFNHAQFYGATAVDGNIGHANFGRITKADNPRFVQIAAKFSF